MEVKVRADYFLKEVEKVANNYGVEVEDVKRALFMLSQNRNPGLKDLMSWVGWMDLIDYIGAGHGEQ